LLYSNNPINLNIQLKLNIYCNNKLKFNGEDQGIGRRMCVVNYISSFKGEEYEDSMGRIEVKRGEE
jgi:phage/plasmid-associated DNA primase